MQNSKINIRQTTVSMCEIAVCAALLCVLSPLSIPTPFGVGFTLQVLIVLLTALILKPLHALASQVIYTLLGIVGLP
ncbi:MAG: biotin transporter BioY, partial [Ruminococcus sp.]|nr:biotin transporter BioY [Ruminococcus sp.]